MRNNNHLKYYNKEVDVLLCATLAYSIPLYCGTSLTPLFRTQLIGMLGLAASKYLKKIFLDKNKRLPKNVFQILSELLLDPEYDSEELKNITVYDILHDLIHEYSPIIITFSLYFYYLSAVNANFGTSLTSFGGFDKIPTLVKFIEGTEINPIICGMMGVSESFLNLFNEEENNKSLPFFKHSLKMSCIYSLNFAIYNLDTFFFGKSFTSLFNNNPRLESVLGFCKYQSTFNISKKLFDYTYNQSSNYYHSL